VDTIVAGAAAVTAVAAVANRALGLSSGKPWVFARQQKQSVEIINNIAAPSAVFPTKSLLWKVPNLISLSAFWPMSELRRREPQAETAIVRVNMAKDVNPVAHCRRAFASSSGSRAVG
jgi:hypothetical protein